MVSTRQSVHWAVSALVMISLVLSAFVMVNPTPVKAQAGEAQWELVLVTSVPVGEVSALGGAEAAQAALEGELAQALGDAASFAVQPAGQSAEAADFQVLVRGTGGLDKLQTVVFQNLSGLFPFAGAAMDVEIAAAMPADAVMTVRLDGNMTTGYGWQLDDPDGRFEVVEHTTAQKGQALGAPSVDTLQIKAVQGGDAKVRLTYRRAWQAEEARYTVRLSAPEMPAEFSLVQPFVEDLSLPQAPTVAALGEGETPVVGALPASYDARAEAWPEPAVRDQANCGSCWSFGTVGAAEFNYAKSSNSAVDFSEQFLISCNKDKYGCTGGFTASKYHYDTKAKNQLMPGPVLESDMPYLDYNTGNSKRTNVPCTREIQQGPLVEWNYLVSGWDYGAPSVDAIKAAIYKYGAVTAGVCVDPGWYSYTGGVYATDAGLSYCNGAANHQIVLVGWNDATSSWILRNSWGPSWGESGYMRIRYGYDLVGQGASYAAFSEPVEIMTNDTLATAYVPADQGGEIDYTWTGTTAGTTVSADDPILSTKLGQGYNTVWYSVTPWVNGVLKVDTIGSNYDTVLAIYKEMPDGTLKRMGLHDNVSSKKTYSKMTRSVKAFTRYWIEVASKYEGGGNLYTRMNFKPKAPPHNNRGAARKIPADVTSYTEYWDISKATTSREDYYQWSYYGWWATYPHHTVWYKFKPDVSGTATITNNSIYPWQITMFYYASGVSGERQVMPGFPRLVQPGESVQVTPESDPETGKTWPGGLTGGRTYWIGFGSQTYGGPYLLMWNLTYAR